MNQSHLAAALDNLPTLQDIVQIGGGLVQYANGTENELSYDSYGEFDHGRELSSVNWHHRSCTLPPYYKGNDFEKAASNVVQYFTMALTVLSLLFYAYEGWRAHVGWEEIYVAIVELVKVAIELNNQWDTPFAIYQSNGHVVILIHLSNITGLREEYNSRTMLLILTDVGCITMGVTSAFAQGPLKIVYFLLGVTYGATTYFNAAKVYIEAYHEVPKGMCRDLVKVMAWTYFVSWLTFPVFFVAGPEGLGMLSAYGSDIAAGVGDIVSKNIWSLLGHFLRIKIREHILTHGDIRKKTKVNIAGKEVEIDTFVEEGEEGGVENEESNLTRRASFVKIKENMRNRGMDVRESLDDAKIEEGTLSSDVKAGRPKGGKGEMPSIDSGRVLLITPDQTVVEYFRQLFGQLPAAIDLLAAGSLDMAVPLVQQAMMMGGIDFVLLHPELLKDNSPQGTLPKLRMMGQRVAAFGWGTHSPMRQMIESCGLDAWLEGPSFGVGIKQEDIVNLVAAMQVLKKQSMMMGMMGGMNTGAMGGMFANGNPMFAGGMGGMMGAGVGGMTGMGGMANGAMLGGMPTMTGNAAMMQQMGSNNAQMAGSNPLFNSPTPPANASPINTISNAPMQMSMTSNLYRNSVQSGMATPTAGNSVSEADVLAQLMQEISRLKSELGDNHA